MSEEGCLFVDNLSKNLTKDHLLEIFNHYGVVKTVKLNINNNINNRLGNNNINNTLSANITYEKSVDADQALYHMDGGKIDGKVIKVSFVLVNTNRRRDNGELSIGIRLYA